jgi:hypothetical protein
MDWIDLAQDRDQLRVLMNTVTNLRVPYDVGKFWWLLKQRSVPWIYLIVCQVACF